MSASTDPTARRVFLDDLRNRVALRSAMHRDEIDDVQIVEAVDGDVLATRELLRVTAPDATGEIDASDVLEAVDILPVRALSPPAPALTPAPAAPAPSAYVPYLAVDAIDQSSEDDAFYARPDYADPQDPPSSPPLTFPLGTHGRSPDATESGVLVRRRRLGWIVATVLTCAVTLVVTAVVTERVGRAESESAPRDVAPVAPVATAESGSRRAAASPPSIDGAPWVTTIDVKNLPTPTPVIGTIVAPQHRALFVDDQLVLGSSAVVTCGKHVVRTGISKKTRTIDVPCGGKIALR